MINIKEKFLELTTKRYPKGTEDEVIKLMTGYDFIKDEFDNYYYIIKNEDGSDPTTMFTSHLDTVDRGPYTSYTNYSNRTWDSVKKEWKYDNDKDDKKTDDKLVKHEFDGDFIKTDGKSNLGADDKAGVVIMLNLMSENVPGLYYFFMGEESGCVGSSNLSRKFEDKVKENELPDVTKCVSFDRRGYDSVITNQSTGDCCSLEFANDLADKLNEYGFWFAPDSTGVYTDSAEFVDIIPECTNLSVGYFSEHTTSEKQDIEFLELLAITLTKIDWDSLTIERDISDVKYKGKKSKSTYSYGRYNYYDEYEDEYNYAAGAGYYNNRLNSSTSTSSNTTPVKTKNVDNVLDFDDSDFDKWYQEQKKKNFSFNENEELVP